MKKVFDETGDFQAYYAATKWCDENSISHGSTDVTNTVGLKYGEWAIAKWKNLTKAERVGCDGTMAGDFRNGPVTINISNRTG